MFVIQSEAKDLLFASPNSASGPIHQFPLGFTAPAVA
jgi:hypothetical protein